MGKSIVIVVGLLAWFGTALFAQGGGAIRGRVVDGQTGAPVAKAEVTLNYNERVTTTDENGSFSYSGVAPGNYHLQVAAEGYVQHSGYPKERFYLSAGAVVDQLILRLAPNGASIEGRVRNLSGEGIKSKVELRGIHEPTYFRSVHTVDGSYRFEGLPAQSYRLYAVEDAFRERLYAPAYYPNTTLPEWASPVALRAGEAKKGIDIILRPEKWQVIQGHLKGACPEDHECEVHYGRIPAPPSASYSPANIKANGRFDLRLPAGKMRISAMAHSRRFGDRALLGEVEVEIRDMYPIPAIEDLEIPMSEGYAVDVQLVSPEPLPRGSEGVGLRLLPIPLRGENYHFRDVGTEEFRFPHVVPALYAAVPQQLPSGLTVQRIEVGGRDVRKEGLRVSGGAVAVTIHLAKEAASVRGRVIDANKTPPGTCQIRAARKGASEAEARLYNASAICSPQGEFALKNLAPGSYMIEARGSWAGVKARSVSLEAGTTEEIVFTVPAKVVEAVRR